MTCRDDAGFRWLRREHRIFKEARLIWTTRHEALDTYIAIMQMSLHINSQKLQLAEKIAFCERLAELPVTTTAGDDGKVAKRELKKIDDRLQKVYKEMQTFFLRYYKVRSKWNRKSKQWRKFIMKQSNGYDALKEMKAEKRRQYLRKCTTCLTVFTSGKGTFMTYRDEWDAMKTGMDQSVIECMKDVALIVKQPTT